MTLQRRMSFSLQVRGTQVLNNLKREILCLLIRDITHHVPAEQRSRSGELFTFSGGTVVLTTEHLTLLGSKDVFMLRGQPAKMAT